MPKKFVPIEYKQLKSRQQENYNFAKVSAILADFGFSTMRLTDDWNGADFIAQHINGETFLKVQLKGRLSFDKKYIGKDIYIAFPNPNSSEWYLYPHDEVLQKVQPNFEQTKSWSKQGGYHYSNLSQELTHMLDSYKLVNSEMKLNWQEADEIPNNVRGHGIEFHDNGETGESEEPRMGARRLVGFVEGFEWYHGRSDEVVIYCIKPNCSTSEAVLFEMKERIKEIVSQRKLPSCSEKLTHRISSWVNG